MDMWKPYIQLTLAHVDGASAKIVFDRFHIAKHLHDAVDQVRKTEHRALRHTHDDRLTETKSLWLMRPEAMTETQRAVFRGLQHSGLKVARVLKERFRQFWEYGYCGAAQTFFTRWFWRATHSRLKPWPGGSQADPVPPPEYPDLPSTLAHQWVKKTALVSRPI